MAMVNPANRNLWIIGALVVVAMAVLAWFLGSGMVSPAADIADVSVEAPPGAGDADRDRSLADAVRDAPAFRAETTAGGN